MILTGFFQLTKSDVIDIRGKNYSNCGDSGALVYMVTDDDELVLIEFKDATGEKQVPWPIWEILQRYCQQNVLTSVNVEFISLYIQD